ncbi:MAG: phosphoribosylanthranilate isomerase [Caulobacteraceae bacterium]
MTTAKICGLSTPETVQAALDGKAAFIGFMFFDKSPRKVDANTAARLAAPVRNKAKVVAVAVDPTDAEVDDIASILKPDLFQLHGKETPQRAKAVADRTGAGLIKVFSVSDAAEIEQARAFDGLVDHLMFDAKAPAGSDRPGGTGAKFDWTLLSGLRFERPYLLAGGLDPWNVTEAVRQSGAPIVDVSSGVERGPGLKDPALIEAFLSAVRRT